MFARSTTPTGASPRVGGFVKAGVDTASLISKVANPKWARQEQKKATSSPWGGGCAWQFDKTAFKEWLRQAIQVKTSKERKELYGFLAECFLDADGDRDGLINVKEFQFLLEKAASLPRRFGLAPTNAEIYGEDNDDAMMDVRNQMFAMMDEKRIGKIGLEQWIQFAVAHISDKIKDIDFEAVDFSHLEKYGAEQFLFYLATAVDDTTSINYKSLYEFLFKTFVESDTQEQGYIERVEFDGLIEAAASAPRALGLAPPTSETYSSEREKTQARDKMFQQMDVNNLQRIDFDNFLNWSLAHIAVKVNESIGSQRNAAVKEGGARGAAPAPARVAAPAPVSPRTAAAAPAKNTGRSFVKAGFDTSALVAKANPKWARQTQKTTVTAPWGGGCAWQFDQTAFKEWLRQAIQVKTSKERKELYGFLAECFLDADGDRDGLINVREFQFLLEKAAALPRRFGLAPANAEIYGEDNDAAMMEVRGQMFAMMDQNRVGKVGLEQWIAFAVAHISDKIQDIDFEAVDLAHLEKYGADQFLAYLAKAMDERSSINYKSLYEFLFKTFVEADSEQQGYIELKQFDELIEQAASAPRALGLAPPSSETYASEAEKKQARRAMFDQMDIKRQQRIYFDNFLSWSMAHIAVKVSESGAGGNRKAW